MMVLSFIRHRSDTALFVEPMVIADDSASVSSTVTVDTDLKRKRVHFNDTAPVEYTNHIYCEEDCKDLWYRPRDYRMFRAYAIEAAQQIIAVELRNRAPYSYQRVLERAYEICTTATAFSDNKIKPILPDSDFVHLQRWLEVATSRVGLEKWAMRSIAADKSERRRIIIETVLSTQVTDCLSEQEEYDVAEFIRASCERISRPGRLFARTMAQAQATAVQKENFFQ